MSDIRAAFGKQLAEADICDGDYLQGESYNNAFNNFVERNPHLITNEAQDIFDKRIAEYKLHTGDHKLFFLAQTDQPLRTYYVWWAEIDDLDNKWALVENKNSDAYFPRLRLK